MTAATPHRRRTLRHVTSPAQFDRDLVEYLLDRADALDGMRDEALRGRILVSLFFEPSTRTRLSFESAMVRRGGSVIGSEAAGAFSSAAKGETLEDSVKIVSAYGDVVVLRHTEAGAAARAAAVSAIPVINAGDGAGDHPTQALLDLYCIRRERGGIDGVHMALCGDLRHSRTIHSLVRLLALFHNVRLTLVAPPGLEMPAELISVITAAGVTITPAATLAGVAGEVDVVYQTRVQRERLPNGADVPASTTVIDLPLMGLLRPDAVVMDPLPRVGGIDPAVDTDPRAAYFRQAAGGVAVRMAILEMLLT